MDFRQDSLFICSELVDELSSDQFYEAGDIMMPEYEFEYSGSIRIKVFGREKWFNLSDQGLKKLRHEMVSSVMGPETDELLSTIGVTGPTSVRTPDFILKQRKVILEITTVAGNDDSAMLTAMKGKRISYLESSKSVGYDLAIIVVSRTKVLTNLKLSQSAVNALILRFRIGFALEAKITDELGENIFSEDWSVLEEHCKARLGEITGYPESNVQFDLNTILKCAQDPKPADYRHTGKALKQALMKSTKKSGETDVALSDYLKTFDESYKTGNKRITNIPMITCSFNSDDKFQKYLDPEVTDMPSWLKSVWCTGRNKSVERISLQDLIKEASGNKDYELHRNQKQSAFNCELSDSDRIEAAKSGLWAKSLKDHPDIVEKDIESHKSFHPILTNTNDIEHFMNKDLYEMTKMQTTIPKDIFKMIKDAKSIYGGDSTSLLMTDVMSRSTFSEFSQTISELFTEICYAYKYWIKRSDFYHKIHKGVHMLIRCTGDHVFVSYAFPKQFSEIIDTGRLGPRIWESDNYYFTDFSSYNEPTVEHFVKAGPYLMSILFHLTSHYDLRLDQITNLSPEIKKTMNGIMLLYLNNKTDVEELITNQRYLTMGILEELDPNPYRFCDRLPDVYRSRLSCYFVKNTIRHMQHYADNKIKKYKTGIDLDESVEHDGLLSIFTNQPLTLKQKVNEFYFGYVISKERGRGSDRNFKIMKKIVAEEYRFRDTVVRTFEETLDPKMHVSNPIIIKVFLGIFRSIWKKRLGKDWKHVITKAIFNSMARKNFYEIATMKVASRSYNDRIEIPDLSDAITTHDIRKKLEDANPNETKRRPRVMEALTSLVERYTAEQGEEPIHPIDLLPYCLTKLESKGYFDSDIFPKPQHGGDREIHVLEIMMRVVQLFLETISRTLCDFIDSDSLTHSTTKDNFVKNHYKAANQLFSKQFITLGKSADATKWCQRHHSSKFAAMLVGVTGMEFWSFILRSLHMWQNKRISFPIQFAANFMSNAKTKSNKIYERMRDEFFNGTGIFKEAYNSKMWIKSGMMQGILHYTSSFTHGVLQEVMKKIQEDYLIRKGIQNLVTVIQGSDDSAELISLSGGKPKHLTQVATVMLHWKENMGKYFSIYTSRAKSSIGTLDLIEYNSEWHIRSTTIKPTFRWVSSCLETGIVEKFIDRYQNMYGTATTVLEGGGKVLEVALIQICQAWMHYMLLGFHTSDLAELTSYFLLELKDPSMGYFALDSDYNAGITGYNFMIYQLYTRTNYGHGLGRTSVQDIEIDFFEEDNKDPAISRDLRKVRLKFGNHKIFNKIVRDMSIPELTEIVKEIENDPSLLYYPTHEWSASKHKIFLKVFEPGVKESLSRHSATARMMSASAYILSRPCLTHPKEDKKCSLFYIIAKEYHQIQKIRRQEKLDANLVFLHGVEYATLTEFLDTLNVEAIFQQQHLKTRSKQKIIVFDIEEEGPSLIEMCKRKWFGRGSTYYSHRQFNAKWKDLKVKYLFLRDTREETKQTLGLNDVQMKNFLEAQSEKTRSITLLDTSAKTSSVRASMTRVFWNNTKIMIPRALQDSETVHALRSRLFSVLTSWMSNTQKKNVVSHILSTTPLLQSSIVPSQAQKLKCIRDLIVTRTKESAVQRILRDKIGSVGFFTVRQSGYGENRRGFGEWKGKVLDSDVRIEMNGNLCVKIELNNLNRSKELGYILSNLVRGFSLKYPKKLQDCDHWLSESGKISGGRGKKISIPIYIIPELRVDIIDQITKYPWHWELDHNKIKIVADVDASTKIVVLVETLTSYDWDPYLGFEGENVFEKWSRGDRIDISEIQQELAPMLSKSPADKLKIINNPSVKPTANGWNLLSLTNTLKYFYGRKADNIPIEPPMTGDPEDVSDVDSLIEFMMEADIENLDEELEFVENEDDLAEFEMNDADMAEVEAQLDILLQTADPTLGFKVEKDQMSVSNQSLSNLNILCRAQIGKDLGDAIIEFKRNSGLFTYGVLGFILSLITGRYCMIDYETQASKEIQNIESDSISVITSLKSEMETEDMSREELLETIDYVKATINSAPPRIKKKLQISLKRYEAALRTVDLSEPMVEDIEQLNPKEVFHKNRDQLMPVFFPNSAASANPDLFYVQMCNKLDSGLDQLLEKAEISPLEHAVYRESVPKSYFTAMLADAIALCSSTTVQIKDYISAFGDTVIKLS